MWKILCPTKAETTGMEYPDFSTIREIRHFNVPYFEVEFDTENSVNYQIVCPYCSANLNITTYPKEMICEDIMYYYGPFGGFSSNQQKYFNLAIEYDFLYEGCPIVEQITGGLNGDSLAIIRQHVICSDIKGYILSIDSSSKGVPLIRAVVLGKKHLVKSLIKQDADVNEKNPNGYTALMGATYGKGVDLNIMKLLIKNGADVNMKNNKGETALMLVAIVGGELTAKILIKNGADVNMYNNKGETALMWSIINEHKTIFKFLLKNGADINTQDYAGNTALIYSAVFGRKSFTKYLIKHGADVNLKNNKGNSALLIIAEGGIISERVSLERKYYTRDPSGLVGWKRRSYLVDTFSNIGVNSGSASDIFEILLNNGANINVRNNQGLNALELTKRNDWVGLTNKLTKLLVQHRAEGECHILT